MITTNDDALAERVRILRVHGGAPKYYHKTIGGNFRLDPLQAALLRAKLGHLPVYIAKRRANAARYLERLAESAPVRERRLLLPSEMSGRTHTWNQFTLRVTNGKRDALMEHLAANQIGSAIYYPVPLHRQECFSNLAGVEARLPICEKMADEVLSIPIYPELSTEQIDHVINTIANAPI